MAGRPTASTPVAMEPALAEFNSSSTIAAIHSGDGGTSNFLSAARSIGFQGNVLLLPGGNANDLAHQVYDLKRGQGALAALARSAPKKLFPLELTANLADGTTETRDVYAYCSWGASALTGALYNQPEYREQYKNKGLVGREWMEKVTAKRGYFNSPQFTIKGAEQRRLFELIVANGNRMAKYFKFHARLFENEAQVIEVADRLKGILEIGRLVVGRDDSGITEQPIVVEFTDNTPLRWQIDGEDYIGESPASFTFKRALNGVNILTALRTADA